VSASYFLDGLHPATCTHLTYLRDIRFLTICGDVVELELRTCWTVLAATNETAPGHTKDCINLHTRTAGWERVGLGHSEVQTSGAQAASELSGDAAISIASKSIVNYYITPGHTRRPAPGPVDLQPNHLCVYSVVLLHHASVTNICQTNCHSARTLANNHLPVASPANCERLLVEFGLWLRFFQCHYNSCTTSYLVRGRYGFPPV
jgi:hypothetical protein